MRLGELFDGLVGDQADVEIASMALDDRLVEPGALFCCILGLRRDGHDFAPTALERGAVALLVARPLGLAVPEVVVDDVRAALAPAAALLNGQPTRQLKMVGITGTNGKTTTAYLTRALLEAGKISSGMVGTVEQIIGGRRAATVRTTPEATELQACFAAMLAAGDRACVIEVSSHALTLHRADAIDWDLTVFLNLSREHLDFHADMDEYFEAKASLLRCSDALAVVNIDDQYGRRLAAELGNVLTVGIESDDADLVASEIEGDARGSRFRLGDLQLSLPLPGRFNVLNALCAVAAARQLGVGDGVIAEALATAELAPGRFQPVSAGQDFAAIIDYAHTPDSLDNALGAARALSDRRLIVVFGAGGDRDQGKRPLMGQVAAAKADVVIVTSDNPRSEAPEAIIAAIIAGIEPGSAAEVESIVDRQKAIETAVGMAEEGDLVLVAGKGHECGQELADGVMTPFDDLAVLRGAIEAAAQ